jgi:diadenosine tetraphosphate (Ap4A) HIT family hydrolase
MSAGPDRLYHLAAARSDDQRAYMERLEADGICVFCPEHVAQYHGRPVTYRGRHWYVTENAYPYEGTAAHHLIVAHRHVTSFHELPDAAGEELWAIKRMLREQMPAVAFATVERSGDMRYNGGSLAHLHTHFVGLEPDPPTTVRFRVSART